MVLYQQSVQKITQFSTKIKSVVDQFINQDDDKIDKEMNLRDRSYSSSNDL